MRWLLLGYYEVRISIQKVEKPTERRPLLDRRLMPEVFAILAAFAENQSHSSNL